MNLKGSKTEKNLYKTFAGESRAVVKYKLYKEVAECEGNMWVGEVFEETSHNELAHARRVYKNFLKDVKNSEYNLLDAIMGEDNEYEKLYKDFEDVARSEGFVEIADFFKELREVEEAHAKRFKEIYKKLQENELYKGNKDSKWICMNCGYIHEGSEAPKVCPLCKYPQGYYKPCTEKCHS